MMGKVGKQHRLEPVVELTTYQSCDWCFFDQGKGNCLDEDRDRFDCCPVDATGDVPRTFTFVLVEVSDGES
jgi:hypothetical protein